MSSGKKPSRSSHVLRPVIKKLAQIWHRINLSGGSFPAAFFCIHHRHRQRTLTVPSPGGTRWVRGSPQAVTPADGSSYRTTDRPPGPPLRSDKAASFVFLCFSSALRGRRLTSGCTALNYPQGQGATHVEVGPIGVTRFWNNRTKGLVGDFDARSGRELGQVQKWHR